LLLFRDFLQIYSTASRRIDQPTAQRGAVGRSFAALQQQQQQQL